MITTSPPAAPLSAATTNSPEQIAGSIRGWLQGWSDLDDIVCKLATDFLTHEGVSVPADANRLNADGTGLFGRPAPVIRALIAALAEAGGGFRYDECDTRRWVVAITDDPTAPDHWRGVAICDRSARLEATALLLPEVYRAVAQGEHRDAQINGCVLAATLWGPERTRWPNDWLAQVCEAIEALATVTVEVLQIPKSAGWPPQIASHRPALSDVTRSNDETVSFQVDADFARFLGGCLQQAASDASRGAEAKVMPEQSVRDSPSRSNNEGKKSLDAKERPTVKTDNDQRTVEPDPASRTTSEVQPESAAQATPEAEANLQRQAIARYKGEAFLLEEAAPGLMLYAMADKSIKGGLHSAGFTALINKMFADCGSPTNPLERLLLRQFVFADFRASALHIASANAKTYEASVAFSGAAARLMSESRKHVAAIQELRNPMTPKVTLIAGNQQVAVVENQTSTQAAAERAADSKLGSNQPGTDDVKLPTAPVQASARRPAKSHAAQRTKSRRPRKASSNGHREPAVEILNGSKNKGRPRF